MTHIYNYDCEPEEKVGMSGVDIQRKSRKTCELELSIWFDAKYAEDEHIRLNDEQVRKMYRALKKYIELSEAEQRKIKWDDYKNI